MADVPHMFINERGGHPFKCTNKLHRASFQLVTTEEGVCLSLTPRAHLACLSLPV